MIHVYDINLPETYLHYRVCNNSGQATFIISDITSPLYGGYYINWSLGNQRAVFVMGVASDVNEES